MRELIGVTYIPDMVWNDADPLISTTSELMTTLTDESKASHTDLTVFYKRRNCVLIWPRRAEVNLPRIKSDKKCTTVYKKGNRLKKTGADIM